MKRILYNIIYTVIALFFAFPVVYTVYLSIKSKKDLFSGYQELLFNCFSFYPAFWNSFLYTTVIIVLQLIIIIPTALAFTQLKSKAFGFVFLIYIILMMMPLQVSLLPVYIGLRDLDMLDTRIGIIFPMVFSPMYVIIMKQFMNTINKSVIEAVTLETNSLLRVIISAVIPQIKPCIYAVVLFSVAETWNMYEEPVHFLKKSNLMPLSVFISNISSYENGIVFCASVLCIIPMLLLFSLFSDYLRKGIVISNETE
jgi:multiple sugar transport system permease protein